MTSEGALSYITLQTPLVQIVLLYAYYYRGEPLRFLHPLREKRDFGAWVDVLDNLGLIKENVTVHENGRTERVIDVIKFLMPTALLSLLGARLIAPVLNDALPLLARFEPIILFLLQFIPAAYFLLLSQKNYLGAPPLEPRRSIVPPKHRSSLIRHLQEL